LTLTDINVYIALTLLCEWHKEHPADRPTDRPTGETMLVWLAVWSEVQIICIRSSCKLCYMCIWFYTPYLTFTHKFIFCHITDEQLIS